MQHASLFPNFTADDFSPPASLTPSRLHHALAALSRLKSLNPTIPSFLQNAFASSSTRFLQRKLSALTSEARLASLQESLQPRDSALILSNSGDPYGFSTVPYLPHSCPANGAWRLMCSRRLLQKIHHNHQSLLCPICSRTLPDPYGDHLLNCPRGHAARKFHWHDKIEATILSLLKSHGWSPSSQVPLALISNPAHPDRRRPDIIAHPPGDDPQLHVFDIVTASSVAASYQPRSSRLAGAAADSVATAKIQKYGPDCSASGYLFFPLAIEDGGRLGSDFGRFILRAASITASTSHKSLVATYTYWRQQIALTNLKGLAAFLFSRLPLPPASGSSLTSPGFQLTTSSPAHLLDHRPPPGLCLTPPQRVHPLPTHPDWAAVLTLNHPPSPALASPGLGVSP